MKIVFLLFFLLASFKSFGLFEPKLSTFESKMKVAYVKDMSSRIVSVAMVFKKSGSGADPIGREGLGWVALQAIYEGGAAGLDKKNFEKELAKLGSLNGLSLRINADQIFLNFECPKENLKKAFELISHLILSPNLPQKIIDALKGCLPPGSRLSSSNEVATAQNILNNKIYGAHFYGRLIATFEGMQPINKEEIMDALTNRFVQENLYLAMVGDVSEAEIKNSLQGTLTKLPEKSKIEVNFEVPTAKFDGSVGFVPKDSVQAGVAFAQKAIKHRAKDYWALRILNKAIGESTSSLLWDELREKRGLVYSVGSDIVDFELDSIWVGGLSCSFDKVVESIKLIEQIWAQAQESGITQQAFLDAKTSLTGAYSTFFISSSSIANLLVTCLSDGSGVDYLLKRNQEIETVTLEDVNRVAKEYLTPKALTFMVVGRPEEELTQFLKERKLQEK